MKNVAAISALLAFCSLSAAQTKPDIQLPAGVRMYEPKNLTPDRAERVAVFVENMSGAAVSWNNVPHAFVIRGKPEVLDMAEALLKRYDVPDPRLELTVYLVRAISSSPAGPGTPDTPLLADLKAAIDEMRGAFNYQRYILWDTIVLQPKGNGGEVQGILPSSPEVRPYVYTVSYGFYGAPSEGKTLNLANFTFSIKMPENLESHIRTDLTIREGQKLVLGKIRLLPHMNADLFLVLTTKVY